MLTGYTSRHSWCAAPTFTQCILDSHVPCVPESLTSVGEPPSTTMTGYDGRIKNTDLLNLREYVTADTGSLNKADSTVLLMVTHSNLKARFMEIRFDRYVSGFYTRDWMPWV